MVLKNKYHFCGKDAELRSIAIALFCCLILTQTGKTMLDVSIVPQLRSKSEAVLLSLNEGDCRTGFVSCSAAAAVRDGPTGELPRAARTLHCIALQWCSQVRSTNLS